MNSVYLREKSIKQEPSSFSMSPQPNTNSIALPPIQQIQTPMQYSPRMPMQYNSAGSQPMQGSTFQNETMMRNHQMKRANYAMMQQSGNIVRSPSNSSLASSQSDSAKRPRKLSAVQTSNVAFNRMGGPQVLQPGVSPNRQHSQPQGNAMLSAGRSMKPPMISLPKTVPTLPSPLTQRRTDGGKSEG